MTSPDPVPEPAGLLAAIVTTEGRTWSATEVTLQLTAELADALLWAELPELLQPTTTANAGSSSQGHRGRYSIVTEEPSGPSSRSRPSRLRPRAARVR